MPDNDSDNMSIEEIYEMFNDVVDIEDPYMIGANMSNHPSFARDTGNAGCGLCNSF